MTLAYNGEPFHGWQVQPNDSSVQQLLEEALAKLLRRPSVAVTGAGRTDAGVHATQMTAHFDTDLPIADPVDFVRRLNAITGRDVAVFTLKEVRPDAHARFDATSRTYHYYAHTRKSPFIYRSSWDTRRGLDFEAMNRAARSLLGTHDFTSFAKLHSDAKTNICTVTTAEWQQVGEHQWRFVITADRFLRNMVRAVVGTLVEVGRGRIDTDGFKAIIDRRDRCSAGTSMPAHALYLTCVEYPDDIYL